MRALRGAASALDRVVRLRTSFVVFGVALAARFVPVMVHGGLRTWGTYDDGVYFAGASALIHGRLPYEQFVLLHPPGILLALSPFAWLGSVTSDDLGLATARIAFMLLGAVSAVLASRLARSWGGGPALAAGLAYALSGAAIYAERTTMLEGLGSLCLLVGLTLLARERPAPLAAGLALGVGAAVKIWGVVPIAVLALWALWRHGWRESVRLVVGAVFGGATICLPFFVVAPEQMFRYVVLDQMGRPRNSMPLLERVSFVAGIGKFPPDGAAALGAMLAVIVVGLAGLAAAVAAWRVPEARLYVALSGVLGLLLMVTPSLFLQYGCLVAAPGAVSVGAAVAWLLGPGETSRVRRPASAAVVLPVVAAVLLAAAIPSLVRPAGSSLPSGVRAAAATLPGCVTADDPTVLILADVLSRDFERGCRVWVDVTGLTYDEAGGRRAPGHAQERRAEKEVWQRQIMDYLSSGTATMIVRSETQLSPESEQRVAGWRALTPRGRAVLLETR